MNRDLAPDIQLQTRMFITVFLLAALYLGFTWVLLSAGTGTVTMVVIIGGMLAAQYYFSDRLVLRSMGAQIVDEKQAPELHAVVERMASMAGVPKPQIAVVKSNVPNAFATGRSPEHSVVAVTTALQRRLEPEEMQAVLAHELTHVKNRDSMVITLASFFATIAQVLMRNFFWFGGGMMGGRRDRENGGSAMLIYLASIVVWVISFFLIRALSRYREYAADRGAAIITGQPSKLSSALMKISGSMDRIPNRDLRESEAMNAFFIIPQAAGGNHLMELLSTHPSLENRLNKLREIEAEMHTRK